MKRTVAHAIETYLGLSETFIYEYLTHAENFTPLVLTNRVQYRDMFPFQPIVSAEQVKRFSWWWLVNGLAYRFHANGFFENWLYLAYGAKQRNASLIHAHFGNQGVKMLALKKKLGIPLVTTFYGFDMSRLPQEPRWQEDYVKLFEEGDLFLVEGQFMKKSLEQLGCPSERISIQRIGIDLSKFRFRTDSRNADSDKIIILFCGRFTEKKGLLVALRAFEKIAEEIPNAEFRIIGDGEQRPEVEAFINQHKLAGCVKLLGYVSHQVYRSELQKAHILLQPSLVAADGDSEGGAPTVLLEAQAMGLPIVSTKHADIPNVLAIDYFPFLSPEKDVECLTENLHKLLTDENLRQKLTEQGRAFVEKNHEIRGLVKQLEDRYENLLTLKNECLEVSKGRKK